MKPQGKIAGTYFLSPEVIAIIEEFARKGGLSSSDALNLIIMQCAKMMVTGVVEEVTEKDVFNDINKELKTINDRLKGIEESTDKIYEATVN